MCHRPNNISPQTDLFCALHSKPSLNPCVSAQRRGNHHHRLHRPIPHHQHHLSHIYLIAQPRCASGFTENSHAVIAVNKITLFRPPTWRLLSQEYIMPVPCMAGPVPGRWQCSSLSAEVETLQTSQLCSYAPHAGPVHPQPLILSEEVSGFE